MVLSWLLKKVNGGVTDLKRGATPGISQASVPGPPVIGVQNIYPPEDQGLPLRDFESLLNGNASLIHSLKLHAAADKERFEARFLRPIRILSEHINTLPGTASGLFSGEGGLLRAALELGFLSFQASDGRIFTGAANVETRHALEPRWRYICFAAGLLYPIGLPLSRMVVTTKGGAPWEKHQYGLSEWASKSGVDRLYVNWPNEGTSVQQEALGPSPYSGALVSKIFGHEILSWLDAGSPELTRTLFEIVGGSETQSRIAKDVITTMWGKVKQREETRRPQTYGRMTVGTHLAPYLIGAMKAMVESGEWTPNKLPFIVDSTGIYLVWPKAGEDIVVQGAREGRDGWPASASSLAELLKHANIFDTARGNDLGMTEVVDLAGDLHSAFKLANPNAIYEGYSPSEYVKTSPKTLSGVIDADPLSKSEVRKAAPVARPKAAPLQPEVEADKQLSLGISSDPETGEILFAQADSEQGGMPVDVGVGAGDEEPQRRQTETIAQLPAATSESSGKVGKIKETDVVKFSDLVPESIRKDMKTALATELLGKVIKAWRERGEQSTTMRMTDNGAAISVAFLGSLVRNLPDWVNEISEAGLVYSPPSHPGLKIQKIAIPEGTPAKEAVVLSRYGCKKLEL